MFGPLCQILFPCVVNCLSFLLLVIFIHGYYRKEQYVEFVTNSIDCDEFICETGLLHITHPSENKLRSVVLTDREHKENKNFWSLSLLQGVWKIHCPTVTTHKIWSHTKHVTSSGFYH